MAEFKSPPENRNQIVLFPEKLDDAISPDHPVRLLDDILRRIDWSAWEAKYVLVRGQPPIHPRVIASVILYGILKRIRTTRALEEAIEVRLDFRWLCSGQRIDHSTISKFRITHKDLIKGLFVQVALIAQQIGRLTLQTLGFDGTKIKANNRRSGSRTPKELQAAKEALTKQFEHIQAQIELADKKDLEGGGTDEGQRLNKELLDVGNRKSKIETAVLEIETLEKQGEKVPDRIPTTDPQSRINPNKEGGFAPNYTPTVTVDIDSGMIVGTDVHSSAVEEKFMIPQVDQVVAAFSMKAPPKELLADGLMCSGENLAACKERKIDFYSPTKVDVDSSNPAIREDLTKPVPNEMLGSLPILRVKHAGGTTTQFHKNAFVYDAEKDIYWCPNGKSLSYQHKTSEVENNRTRIRYRYACDPSVCSQCPMKENCISGSSPRRTINHEQHEELRQEHAKKMTKAESKTKYSRRRHSGERPFAVIKQHFGARQFLTRGLKRVECEWSWLVASFNLKQLMGILQGGTGPPLGPLAS